MKLDKKVYEEQNLYIVSFWSQLGKDIFFQKIFILSGTWWYFAIPKQYKKILRIYLAILSGAILRTKFV
jgi:hypothetical protein